MREYRPSKNQNPQPDWYDKTHFLEMTKKKSRTNKLKEKVSKHNEKLAVKRTFADVFKVIRKNKEEK
ncbi:MAG: hypothetical protein C5B59_02405 [Bacteroidetes bacterium]|nr:MAG: hypothetical protein C5B59_02405 [Bacteroidota bacterium]